MSFWFKTTGKMIGGGARAGNNIGHGLADAAATRRAANVGARQAKRGWLAPGDPTPSPTVAVDYLDYRGTAVGGELQALNVEGFPIGSFVDFQRSRIEGQLALPEALLNLHALILGPAGSGKTAGVIVPWISTALAAGWSVIAVDVKGGTRNASGQVVGGLKDDIIEFNDRHDNPGIGTRIKKWDFTDPDGSHVWEWTAELTDDARLDAAITAILGRPKQNSTADPYFYQRDFRLLRGLLRFAHSVSPHTRTAGQLIRMLQNDVRLQNAVLANRQAPGADELVDALRHPPHEYAKVVSGVVTALSTFDNQGASAITAAKPSAPKLSLDSVLSEGDCLIVGAPLKGGQASVALSSLMLNQLTQRLYERFGAHQRPVLLVIDEAAQMAERVDIAQLMEVSRSAGVGVVVALQDASAFSDENERSSIFTNAATLVMLPGCSSLSVEQLSKRLGSRPERTYSMQNSGAWGAPVSQSYSTQMVPVLGEREILQPPAGDRPAVVHIKTQGVTSKPFVTDLYYE